MTVAMGSPRHALRRRITMYPSVYLPLANWKKPGSVLGTDTQLVLDGFTRSASTFAVVAFQLAQNDHVRVAHHLHAAAHLTAATALHVPALVTVREPEPTIVSALIREPRVTPRQWLKTYVAFYQRILPLRDKFVIATFDQVTSDFGAVSQRVNEQFGTSFREFEHNEENVAVVFALIEERVQGLPWSDLLRKFISGFISADEFWEATRAQRDALGKRRRPVPELRVQRPSAHRETEKAATRDRYREAALAPLRARAEQAYQAFVG